jgi:hypothetical protein
VLVGADATARTRGADDGVIAANPAVVAASEFAGDVFAD